MGFFTKLWMLIRGFFTRAGDDLVSGSPDAIKSTYAAAIEDSKARYRQMAEAVSLLATERERTELRMQNVTKEKAELEKRLEGALAAAAANPNDASHKEAGARYLERIKEIETELQKLSSDHGIQMKKVEEYKTKLRSFSTEIDKLKREQGEMVAEFVSSQQVIQLENRLQGLGESAVDESIVAIRDKVANLKSRAKIATEMSSSTVASQDTQYEQLGAKTDAINKFDELLKARTGGTQELPREEKMRDLG